MGAEVVLPLEGLDHGRHIAGEQVCGGGNLPIRQQALGNHCVPRQPDQISGVFSSFGFGTGLGGESVRQPVGGLALQLAVDQHVELFFGGDPGPDRGQQGVVFLVEVHDLQAGPTFG